MGWLPRGVLGAGPLRLLEAEVEAAGCGGAILRELGAGPLGGRGVARGPPPALVFDPERRATLPGAAVADSISDGVAKDACWGWLLLRLLLTAVAVPTERLLLAAAAPIRRSPSACVRCPDAGAGILPGVGFDDFLDRLSPTDSHRLTRSLSVCMQCTASPRAVFFWKCHYRRNLSRKSACTTQVSSDNN